MKQREYGYSNYFNGKKAGLEPVRTAIFDARANGNVEVRVTWEAGDVNRQVQEACNEGCSRLVAGGGDGTVNEITDALLKLPVEERPEIAILPLGTANDFATACTIPSDPLAALSLAQSGQSYTIDAVQAYIWATPMPNSMGMRAGLARFGVTEENNKILVFQYSALPQHMTEAR